VIAFVLAAIKIIGAVNTGKKKAGIQGVEIFTNYVRERDALPR